MITASVTKELNPDCATENYLLKKSDSVRIGRESQCISRFDD